MASCEIEEVNRWRVQVDVEAVLDTLKDCSLVDIVVAGIDDAGSFRPTLLCCTNRCPENSFAAAASVATYLVNIVISGFEESQYQNGWKKPTMPSHCWSRLLPTFPSVATDARSSQS